MISRLSTKSRTLPTDPIGVFDSGVGGLSVLREMTRLLPGEWFVFLADQSHVPYGGKTAAQLKNLATRVVRFLLRRRCKTIVVACNTATVYTIAHLRSLFPVPFIGTVPAVKPAASMSASGVIGVISTPATARSPELRRLITAHAGNVRVIRKGCPGLEELVEAGGIDDPLARTLLKKYLQPLRDAGADIVVLGCTHYPFLKRTVARLSGARTLDSGYAIARRTKTVLADLKLRSPRTRGGSVFYTTGDAKKFSFVATKLLRRPITAQKARI